MCRIQLLGHKLFWILGRKKYNFLHTIFIYLRRFKLTTSREKGLNCTTLPGLKKDNFILNVIRNNSIKYNRRNNNSCNKYNKINIKSNNISSNRSNNISNNSNRSNNNSNRSKTSATETTTATVATTAATITTASATTITMRWNQVLRRKK